MDFENYAYEHVLSYQRRIQATKEQFMRRNKKTPLGIIQDWWLVGRRWGDTLMLGGARRHFRVALMGKAMKSRC